MPAKKSKAKKKKVKEIDPEEALRQELLKKALSLQGEIQQEHALEEEYQQQTSILSKYWDIEKKHQNDKKAQLLQKQHRLDGIADKHTIELNQYKQTIKQLLFTNQDELSEKITQYFIQYRSLEDTQHKEIGQLYNELYDITTRIRETTMSYDKFIISLRQGSNNEITMLRDDAHRKISMLANYCEKQYRATREISTQRLLNECQTLEEENEDIIQQIIEKNKDKIQQKRTVYSMTMNENLDTISTLRKEVVLLREQDRHDRYVLNELQTQNSNIITPLEANKKELTQLELDLEVYTKQKHDLDTQKQKLRHAQEELKSIEWDHEVLFQKLQQLEVDRNDWKKKVQQCIHSTKQKSNYTNLKLEQKLNKLSLTGEQNTAATIELLRKANVDLDTLDMTSSENVISDVIGEKKNQVRLLQQKLNQIKEDHATMIERYKHLLEEG